MPEDRQMDRQTDNSLSLTHTHTHEVKGNGFFLKLKKGNPPGLTCFPLFIISSQFLDEQLSEILLKSYLKGPGRLAYTYKPSYLGSEERRITVGGHPGEKS
jgi:hypothetical protein